MKKHPEIVALILLVMLTAFTAAQQLFIFPVVQGMLATAGVPLNFPARVFIAVSRYGIFEFVAFVLVTLLALGRVRPADDRARKAQVLNVAGIIVVLVILGQASLFVDLSTSAGRIMHSASTGR